LLFVSSLIFILFFLGGGVSHTPPIHRKVSVLALSWQLARRYWQLVQLLMETAHAVSAVARVVEGGLALVEATRMVVGMVDVVHAVVMEAHVEGVGRAV
jgi:hypothetical protein